MFIDFMAFADDYTAQGEILLRDERLADQLALAHEVRVDGATVRALEDGRQYDLAFAVIGLDELCAVVATGPRGNADLRHRTRAYPMRAEVGPYSVVGYLHAKPTADPLIAMQRRAIIALSPARLAFVRGSERIEKSHDALLLVSAKVGIVESASDEDIGLLQ